MAKKISETQAAETATPEAPAAGTETATATGTTPAAETAPQATGTAPAAAETQPAETATAEEAQAVETAAPEAPAVAEQPLATVTHVVVYCNLPAGLSFRLPDGRKLTFAGYPVSRLVGADGQALRAGKFGKTRNVRVEDWAYIAKTYAACAYLSASNPLLFAAASEAEGDAMARELAETRSGLEQVDVRAPGGQTRPLDEED